MSTVQRLSTERGFAGTPVVRVAREAGVASTTVSTHVPQNALGTSGNVLFLVALSQETGLVVDLVQESELQLDAATASLPRFAEAVTDWTAGPMRWRPRPSVSSTGRGLSLGPDPGLGAPCPLSRRRHVPQARPACCAAATTPRSAPADGRAGRRRSTLAP
ncbi:hypothetical protein [Modestobacter sp. Leaf380]|uniref:hypothetical protein n=1 Tax=Modestobacter sp. Leaf380 TaxID=1736356 RepID=UPI00190FE222|nr:hypothetical protein [Modestobacter sp. Leaf380]